MMFYVLTLAPVVLFSPQIYRNLLKLPKEKAVTSI